MKTEAEFKSLIKKSITHSKGFSLSLAAPMLVGLPDLFVVMPGYIPILLEAKWLKHIERKKFNRKLLFTDKQIDYIKTCDNIVAYSAMGLIGFYYNNKLHAALVKYGTPLFYQFSNTFLTDCAYVIYSETTKRFDIQELFAKVPIPRLPVKQGTELIVHDPQPYKMAI